MTTQNFGSLGVPAKLVDALTAVGVTTPFPIQAGSLPDSLSGRDVLGRGKTGSGKTLAFAIPMISRLGADSRSRASRPRGLVLAPTRELATQISTAMHPMANAYGLKVTTIFGGVSQVRQVSALRAGVDIVVACPGRLEDLMKQGVIKLEDVEITVIDEADHMADLGFLPTVTRIMNSTPKNGQRMLFSATLDNGVDILVKRYLTNPATHSVDSETSHVTTMTHHVFEVADKTEKDNLVQTLASGQGRRILFVRTKHQAKRLGQKLTAAGIPAVDLHGNLSQPQRDRNLAAFSDGSVRVLVATDIAARGVHVDDVSLVVHVDPPVDHKAYLHRSGRTARAGQVGDVTTICLPTERPELRKLLRRANINVDPKRVTTASEHVRVLVGDVAEHVTPTARPTTTQPQRAPGAPNANRRGGRGRGRNQAGRAGRPVAAGRSGR